MKYVAGRDDETRARPALSFLSQPVALLSGLSWLAFLLELFRPRRTRDGSRTRVCAPACWTSILEARRHAAVIPAERRKNLVFCQLGRSAVAVTRRSVFVVSHGDKVQSQGVRVRRRCAVFL
jgi:hypothetical protein